MQPRNIALAVASSLALMLAAQPAGADDQTTRKANIKTDNAANNCLENCVELGHAWAKAHGVTDAEDCDAGNDEVALGCRNFVLESMPAMPAEGAEAEAAEAEAAAAAAKQAARDAEDALQLGDTREDAAEVVQDAHVAATEAQDKADQARAAASEAPQDADAASGNADDAADPPAS
jgi:hypothetical protein